MFDQLNSRFSQIIKDIRGQGKITDANISGALRDVRRALLEADVNFIAAKAFIERVKKVASGNNVFDSVTPGQQFVKILLDELTAFLGGNIDSGQFNFKGRTIILLAGLQGSGKTTSAAKLACFLKKKWQKKPFLIAADLQRPAAIDQLEVLGKQLQIPVYADKKSNIEKVIADGLINSKKADIVIIDTAGRLHLDDELMVELELISKIAKPDEIIYVADGMSGQDAVNSSKAFNERLNLSGVLLTKLDGDSRGGAALSIKEVTGKPIKFIGTGEKINDFDIFHPDRMAKRILGMGDVATLVEKAQVEFDEQNAKKIHRKLMDNSFTLVDFQIQLKQMQKLGPMSDLLKMVPGMGSVNKMKFDDRRIKWVDAIIDSMTIIERQEPNIINGSRRKRIALGSGRSIQEVNQLIKQFHQMKKMMKKIGNNKGSFRMPFGLK